jgi:hypothetical protein
MRVTENLSDDARRAKASEVAAREPVGGIGGMVEPLCREFGHFPAMSGSEGVPPKPATESVVAERDGRRPGRVPGVETPG